MILIAWGPHATSGFSPINLRSSRKRFTLSLDWKEFSSLKAMINSEQFFVFTEDYFHSLLGEFSRVACDDACLCTERLFVLGVSIQSPWIRELIEKYWMLIVYWTNYYLHEQSKLKIGSIKLWYKYLSTQLTTRLDMLLVVTKPTHMTAESESWSTQLDLLPAFGEL